MSFRAQEIAYSCYAVTDVDRAKAFYGGVLGLKECFDIKTPDGQSRWVEYDVGGAALSLGQTADWRPSADGCTVALEVEDFDSAIAHLRAHNVKITM